MFNLGCQQAEIAENCDGFTLGTKRKFLYLKGKMQMAKESKWIGVYVIAVFALLPSLRSQSLFRFS